MPFTRILLPVDFSNRHRQAIEIARDLAPAARRVTLLHVIETLDLPHEEVEDFYRQLEERARTRLGELATQLAREGLEVLQHVRYGRRVAEIVAFTREEAVDLVVMTSHREDPEDPGTRWLSISHQVGILAPVPVLLVR